MKKVAIISCLNMGRTCPSDHCHETFCDRTAEFARYADTDARLVAFLRCNGCDNPPDTDPNFPVKLQRLLNTGAEVVHFGECTRPRGNKCPRMERFAEILTENGLEVVWGTHGPPAPPPKENK